MRTPVKGIALMGNRYEYGGICLTPTQELFIVSNGTNKVACYDLLSDAVLWSANAFGYANFCEVRGLCYLDSAAYNPSLIYLLKNGEVWRKDLSDFTEEKWGKGATDIPECRGASGIEYHNGSLYVTFPQFNMVRRMALNTLDVIAQGYTGVPTDSPYPPAAISWDAVNSRFACIDPVKGDIVYLDENLDEIGRERYTFEFYNRCFDGDIAWSKAALPNQPGRDFFVACIENHILLYMEPWYRLWEIDDITGTATAIEAIVLDNVEVGENIIKHIRIENPTALERHNAVVSVTNDPTMMADDRTWVGASQVGPWGKSVELGDVMPSSSADFWVRFHPDDSVDLGTFSIELVVDYTKV